MRNGERFGEARLYPGGRSLRRVERLGMSGSSRVRSAGTRSTRSGRLSSFHGRRHHTVGSARPGVRFWRRFKRG
jgi:hypothetical protein